MIIFFGAIFAILMMAEPAAAAPVAVAIVGALKTVAAWKIGTFAIGSFLLKTAASFAVSALARAKMGQKQGQEQAGIRTESTLSGEETSGSIILGKYATGGTMVAPPMTDGLASKTPNIYLTYVIDLGDMPIESLDGIWIGDQKCEILPPEPSNEQYPSFHRLGGEFLNQAWFTFFDGTQTAASEVLLGTDGNGRPWAEDMIGRGIPYVIIVFRFNRDLYQGLPECLFEVTGIRLYDPRKDSTVGGSGPHRWGQPATYDPSENPAVQIYNILRGIELPDGSVWGGEAEAEDLPLDSWFAQMNEADEVVNGAPRWRSSYEIKIGPQALGGDTPADVIETILRGCSGAIAEAGGVYKIRLGGPGLPVAAFTDDDIIITSDQQYRPFKGMQETFNGIQAQFPEPRELWANKEAPPRYNRDWEIEDGDRRLVASLALPATPYPDQVQRVMAGYIKDARRDRVIDVPLPPDYGVLECLDSVAYTSVLNGFATKVFEVTSRSEDLQTLIQQVGARERDSGDYVWTADQELPSSVGNPTTTVPPPRSVLGFGVEPFVVRDAEGAARRPAIRLYWDGDQPDARGIQYRVRLAGASYLAGRGSITGMDAGEHIVSEGILPQTAYEVSAQLTTARATVWTGWIPVFTPDVRLSGLDLRYDEITAEVREHVAELEAWSGGTGDYLRGLRAELAAIRDSVAEVDGATWLQHKSLSRQLGVQVATSRAEYTEWIDVAVSKTAALAVRMETVDATIGLGEHAEASDTILARVSQSEGAISENIQWTEAMFGRTSANGLIRIASEATTAGAQTRIGIRAEATEDDTTHSAAFYLVARSDGQSEIDLVAERVAIVESSGTDATRRVLFVVDDGVAYMDVAFIRDATLTRAKIGNNQIYADYFFETSDVTITASDDKAAPVLLMSETISGFEGGGFIASFSAFADNTMSLDSFGTLYMRINGVTRDRQRFGVRSSGGGDVKYTIPVNLTGTANSGSDVVIEVWGYNSHWDSDDYGSNTFAVVNMSLTVSGARR